MMTIFVILYRRDNDSELKVCKDGYQTLEDAQNFIEGRANSPEKEPCTNYRYRTDVGEEYLITEVRVGR